MFDIRIVDTDAQSYRERTPLAVLCYTEHNKLKYSQACQDRRATFTPLVLSVDGMMGCEATAFFRQIADLLSARWDRDFSSVMEWVHTRLSFATLHATLLCVQDVILLD